MSTKIKAAQFLDELELNKLLKYLSRNQLWTYYIMVRLGVSTALRFGDLSGLKWEDVIGKNVIIIKEKKTGKIREVPLGMELRQILQATYFNLGKPELSRQIIPITIRGVNKQIKVLAYRAGIRKKRVSTHSLRKTFGREVWRRNGYSDASLIRLSQLFNHSSTSITRIYLDITREEVQDMYDIDDLFHF